MRRIIKTLLWAIVLSLLTGAATTAWILRDPLQRFGDRVSELRSHEVVRHLLRRLEGHNRLEALLRPPLLAYQRQIERPVSLSALPPVPQGQRSISLPDQAYDRRGKPIEVQLPAASEPGEGSAAGLSTGPDAPSGQPPIQLIADVAELAQAVTDAQAGADLVLLPGRYRLDRTLSSRHPGAPERPIRLRALTPGTVEIESSAQIAIKLQQPHWVVENLTIRGVCANDSDCEHAFQVIGAATASVIRNNRLLDFNAAIKVNGVDGRHPDHGLLQFNTLSNQRPRQTANPVTMFDLVGASGWVVADNLVSDFVKDGGNGVAYGLFMKGGGADGRIARNRVICTSSQISRPGVRVGISFGGGRTDPASCRDRRCLMEHFDGVASDNIVAHCNDSGLDVNTASNISLQRNTLVNTAGISVRGAGSSARSSDNLLDGPLLARDGSTLDSQGDQRLDLRARYPQIDALDFATPPR